MESKTMRITQTLLVISAFALLALPLAAEPHSTNQNAFADLPSKQPALVHVVLPAVTNQSLSAVLSLFSTNKDYQLRCGDLIEVKVYGEDDLATRVRLNEIGTVDLPLLPGVALTGHTQTQACERIRQLYMKDFLVDPMISLTILEYGKSKVT